ncbi:hypothetical protein [uncultured Thiodictyon sp.]|uniref:hypothetical protein n=1 Tax=uncultured Thiodictyon sp. TaxID=1846217 RepID=UPI0025F5A525|nr:hypothetical protein [uncultured Thiodictyon sp.]
MPELLPSGVDKPDIIVHSLPPHEAIDEAPREIRRWNTPDGRTLRIAARTAGGYLLRFPGNADFLISTDCSEIRYRCEQGVAGPWFRHALLDQVIPRTLAQGGRLVLHSSAVLIASGAIGLIGGSGRGKSTLAAAFHAVGAHLLADDSLLLEAAPGGILCAPAYPGVRLWPDSAATLRRGIESQIPLGYVPEKLRCYLNGSGPSDPQASQVPLRAILSLRRWRPQDRISRVRLSRLPSAVAATELMAHSFMFDIGDRGHLFQTLQQAARVASAIPVYLARYPSDLARLPQVCAELTRAINQGPGGGVD